jgi:serine protease Do
MIGSDRSLVILAAVLLVACRPEAGEMRARAPTSQTFRAAVDAVLPAVVYIQVEAEATPSLEAGPLAPLPPGGGLEQVGAGSGVLFRPDGYILTSDHVVREAARLTVTLHDHREFEGRVVARDPSTDVAVVKIDAQGLPTARLGDSDRLDLGDWVLALGSPLNLQFSVTAGVVSAKGRAIGILNRAADSGRTAAPLEHFIQTDAAINPGNSGGPLVNLDGEVVGINTAIASPTGVYAGYGFAVPINLARRAAEELIRYGRVRRGFLGVLLEDVDAADARVYGLPAIEGAEVVHVQEGGPAERAGVQLGDVVVGIAGRKVETTSDLQAVLATLEPGTTTRLRLFRYGRSIEVPVQLGVITSGERPAPPPRRPEGPARIGFAVDEQGGRLVVVAVQAYSPAYRAGIRPGQEVLAVNRREVRSLQAFATAVASSGDVVSLIVRDPRIGRLIINYELRR